MQFRDTALSQGTYISSAKPYIYIADNTSVILTPTGLEEKNITLKMNK